MYREDSHHSANKNNAIASVVSMENITKIGVVIKHYFTCYLYTG